VLREYGWQIAPSGYWAAKKRRPSARQLSDTALLADIGRIHADNYGVYGVRKVWHELRREGQPVARCTVERLMRRAGLAGARRGRKVRTTVPGRATSGPAIWSTATSPRRVPTAPGSPTSPT
jgi:putative transposase